MSSSESSSTTLSSKQDPIELEKKSHDKSHSKSSSASSSSAAKPVHEGEHKEPLHGEHHAKGEHKHEHKHDHIEPAATAVKQEVQIDKKKKAAQGKVWVGTDDHPQTEEVAISDMTGAHLAEKFGFKTIKYLVSHDNEYIAPDASNSFVYRIKYGMSYLIAGLEEYEDKCIRCRKLFNLTQKKTCRYHPGERVLVDLSKNKKKKKKKGEEEIVIEPTLTEVWSCCKDDEIISNGCCKVKGHVGMIEKNFKPKPLGDEPLDPQYDSKKRSQARKKREAKMEKFKPWQKPAPDTKGVAPGGPTANTNQKASVPKPVVEEFKLKEKPASEEVHVEKKETAVVAKKDSSSDDSSSESSSSSVSSSTTKSD
eukprot:TRINITY_DN2087_c0_g1_i1.p1 TRINITY_DN2087_c0_g1~~TRINITY_DN2087_c0_g1_i1.p1  ORF type:complete len:366 (-),score=156.89 TRINITY_DN2087_c0_g1_i1:35-1132(-)